MGIVFEPYTKLNHIYRVDPLVEYSRLGRGSQRNLGLGSDPGKGGSCKKRRGEGARAGGPACCLPACCLPAPRWARLLNHTICWQNTSAASAHHLTLVRCAGGHPFTLVRCASGGLKLCLGVPGLPQKSAYTTFFSGFCILPKNCMVQA